MYPDASIQWWNTAALAMVKRKRFNDKTVQVGCQRTIGKESDSDIWPGEELGTPCHKATETSQVGIPPG